ncbi:MAG: ATP-binding protein [Gemmataceae bacterium]|nr:ATP-binding protein [Gemmataceae bacterium]
MRSIRLSLIVYFLALLAVALGCVSWLVYRTTAATLAEKQVSSRDLIHTRYHDQCEEAKGALDTRIRDQARTLASMARWSYRTHEPFNVLGVLGTPLLPQGYYNMRLWLLEGMDADFARLMHSKRGTDIEIESADDLLPHPSERQAQEYFQTSRARLGTTKRSEPMQKSESLGHHTLILDAETREKAKPFVEYYDDLQLEPDLRLRRVTLKAQVPRYKHWPIPPEWNYLLTPPFGGKKSSTPPQPQPKGKIAFGRWDPSAPAFFIQYASDTSLLDAKLDQFRAERDERLANLETDTIQALQLMRMRLFWICVITFAGIVAGGLLLVRLGLAPLARMSEAVSQVTEKDFRLKLDHEKLPLELQPIAQRLTQTLEQLQKAFVREKQAAADISHELRTPLAAMMTNLEVALKKSRTPEEYRELLLDIQDSGKQMAQLVERLLALARLDAGAEHLKSENVDAAEVARQCAHMVRPLAEARGLALRFHSDESVPLLTDSGKLREILNNLLHNAIEYNRPHGSIDVDVVRDNGHCRVRVRDTGIGIAHEVKERIFERFFRADPSRHADSPHAGLGLSIVKSYVDLMGGTIAVDSGELGSTFTVDLPVRT